MITRLIMMKGNSSLPRVKEKKEPLIEEDPEKRLKELNSFLRQRRPSDDPLNEDMDPATQDLVKLYKIEGSLDVSKFRSEQKSKLIRTLLKQQSKNSLENSPPRNKEDAKKKARDKQIALKQKLQERMEQHTKEDLKLNGISRELREKILSGEKYKIVPPVGNYQPKYEFILKKNAVDFKFNQPRNASPKRSSEREEVNQSNLQSNKSLKQFPSINRKQNFSTLDDSSEAIPEKIKPHIPNIAFAKQTIRKNESLIINMNDDSNIEYKNVFPEILSKNKKQGCYVKLDKMTNRKAFYKDLATAPEYEVNYSQIQTKTFVPLIGSKPQRPHNTSALNYFSQSAVQSPRDSFADLINIPANGTQSMLQDQHSPSRVKLQLLNKKVVKMEEQGKKFEKLKLKESMDSDKEFIYKKLKKIYQDDD